jgi:HAAS domain-containing protein
MQLTSTGESRVNGYLFVLERSLKTFLPSDVVRDAVREIESHVRERLAAAEALPDERMAVEHILSELGPPLRVAQAYSSERTVDEAVVTGRILSVFGALWRVSAKTMVGFWVALGVSVGYTLGASFLFLAIMKPILPGNVGFWVDNDGGFSGDLAMRFPTPTRQHDVAGYWLIPVCVILGILVLRATHGLARRFLTRWRERRALARTARFVG